MNRRRGWLVATHIGFGVLWLGLVLVGGLRAVSLKAEADAHSKAAIRAKAQMTSLWAEYRSLQDELLWKADPTSLSIAVNDLGLPLVDGRGRLPALPIENQSPRQSPTANQPRRSGGR